MIDDRPIRYFIYSYWIEHEHPPSAEETARHFAIEPAAAEAAYRRLHENHAIFLEPDTVSIRIAHPFSAVPTDFRVWVGEHAYFANCCWDSLGIPAALRQDARIEAVCAESHQPIHLSVHNGQLMGDSAVVHFGTPFRHWYDNVVDT
jgi:hypothetical protein